MLMDGDADQNGPAAMRVAKLSARCRVAKQPVEAATGLGREREREQLGTQETRRGGVDVARDKLLQFVGIGPGDCVNRLARNCR